MSNTTNENDEGIFFKDQIESPLIDEGSCEASAGEAVLKKGPWTSAEDAMLLDYVKKHGEGNWNAVQKHSGLFRCGKSCRLRWANHLRPNLKKGAFTQEEERMIVELHAKMGNKWARMAAHLPGRTDNEIKNYWNTRIKRRQRAGLPIFPPEVRLQTLEDRQQDQNNYGVHSGHKRAHDLMQTNSYVIPDVVFDNLKSHQLLLPNVPEIPDISASGMLMKSLGSSQYCGLVSPAVHQHKHLRESPALFPGYSANLRNGLSLFDQYQDGDCDKTAQSFGLLFSLDADPISKNLVPFGSFQGSHSLSSGNFSASTPTSEAMKLELPSLQYPETDLGSWGASSSPAPLLESVDAFIQSPPNETADSDCLSPHNSGLLDALIYEAKTLTNAKNLSCDKSSNTSAVTSDDLPGSSVVNICKTELLDYGDPVSPLGHSTASLFRKCMPVSGHGSSLDELPPRETFTRCDVKSEFVSHSWTPDGEWETTSPFDINRPDALLGSNCSEQSWGCVKDQPRMSDAIATLLGGTLENEYKHVAMGVPSAGQGWGLGSCAWNNMPPVRQMSELP